jgi:ubiquitin-protein ligase
MTLKRICNEFDIKCSSHNFMSYISNSNFKNLDDIKIIISGNEKIISFYYNKINNEEGYVVEITCPSDYPFRPPRDIHINYEKYYGKIEMSRDEAEFINNKYGVLCTCCDSILCGNNWNPLYRIKYIIDEKNFWDTLLDMYNKLNIIKRKRKNVPVEIWNTIEDYIFISKENYQYMRRVGKYII